MLETQTIVSITSRTALALAMHALLLAEHRQFKMCIAVVNVSGQLQAFTKVDGAPLHSSDIAIDKAYTAVSFGRPTSTWTDRLESANAFLKHGLMNRPQFAGFAGGVPIVVDGVLVGAIGVSGGSASQDEEIALMALQEFGMSS
ncbi:heme-binding protein [Leeia sp. TBRC 13508]|uniref:Heme-binding protein n=1 Tax=Leeia speluncae TaxID=2884804 RepID=A0ABS8DBE7_9NEIS|nr:heme-binding protein [Leeia speluncae]MCB6184953.1 heme-binding protein [Leeia speluncae]